ncbi:protein COFACTOR ASSEMBLY OF COMPLEX C SUBUNIT B CCB3, chloroplastic [Silene latifolia]|uniref:protein COFACTOR ASSEMBLY OF COMPLEX C SUBUNIT B CCB3, chloroplastic n=1 Tax=Silene latifolia TaxID=37657 RepID=UPI003D774AA0
MHLGHSFSQLFLPVCSSSSSTHFFFFLKSVPHFSWVSLPQRAMATLCRPCPFFLKRCWLPSRRKTPVYRPQLTQCSPRCVYGLTVEPLTEFPSVVMNNNPIGALQASHVVEELRQNMLLLDLDPATAKLVIPFIGPFLSALSFLFIVRIVMSWYPKLPVTKFPYVLAYAPTEPILVPTRKVIPPLGGVDVTPVVWFGLLSFLNEILVGPQGLLVLLSQQV